VEELLPPRILPGDVGRARYLEEDRGEGVGRLQLERSLPEKAAQEQKDQKSLGQFGEGTDAILIGRPTGIRAKDPSRAQRLTYLRIAPHPTTGESEISLVTAQ